MPNWCYSRVIICSDAKNIDLLSREMDAALSTNPVGADFGNEWLGNLLLHIGMDQKEVCEGPVRCRGSVIRRERIADDELLIETESAWSPHIECIHRFVMNFLPEDAFQLSYSAEEPNCAVFVTNDPEIANTAYVDAYGLEDLPDEYDYMRDILDYNDTPINDVMKLLKDFVDDGKYREEILNAVARREVWNKIRAAKMEADEEDEISDEDEVFDEESCFAEQKALLTKTATEDLEKRLDAEAILEVLNNAANAKIEELLGEEAYVSVNVYKYEEEYA